NRESLDHDHNRRLDYALVGIAVMHCWRSAWRHDGMNGPRKALHPREDRRVMRDLLLSSRKERRRGRLTPPGSDRADRQAGSGARPGSMRAFLVSNAGAGAAEYALVLACIALLGMGALSLFAANVRSLFHSAVDWVAASSGSGGNSGSSLGNGP